MKFLARVLALLAVALWSLSAEALQINGAAVNGGITTTPPTFTSFSTPGATTYVIPSWAQSLDVWIFGAGGGAGSGRSGASSSAIAGGLGGQAGSIMRQTIPVSALGGPGASVPVVVGAGGSGGATVTGGSSNGNPGGVGNTSGIGTVFSCANSTSQNQFFGIDYNATDGFTQVGTGGVVLVSSSGSSGWAAQTDGATSNQLNGIAHNGSFSVAVGASGTIIYRAVGATTWTAATSNTANNLLAVIWDATNGVFVAVGASGTIDTATTPSGTWTVNSFSSANTINDVGTDGAGHDVAVDSQGNAIYTAAPTSTWTSLAVTTSTSIGAQSIAFGNGKWLIAVVNGLTYYTSVAAGSSGWTAGAALGENLTGVRYLSGWFLFGGVGGLAGYPYGSDAAVSGWNYWGAPPVSGPGGGSAVAAYGAGVWVFSKRADNATQPSQCTLYTANIVSYAYFAVGGGAGAGGTNATVGGGTPSYTMFTAGANGGSSVTATAGSSGFGFCSGGAGGGGITSGNAGQSGGFGGQPIGVPGAVPSAGVNGGVAPSPGVSTTGSQVAWGGTGGAGGSAANGAAGQNGANGGSPCGGGGGGSGANANLTSGAGGNGGNGEVRIIAHASWLLERDLDPAANDNHPMFLDAVA